MKLLLIGVILSMNVSAKPVHTQLHPIENLGTQICARYVISEYVSKDVEELISEYIIERKLGSGDNKSVVNFMNKNKDLLTCPDSRNPDNRRNIIKMAVANDATRAMIYKFLFTISKQSGVRVDFNAVEKINGKFETPLDFIDNEILISSDRGYLKKLKQVRNIMENTFGAKNFNSLSLKIRSQYEENTLLQRVK